MVSILSGVLVSCCLIAASSGVQLWTERAEGFVIVPYVFNGFNDIQRNTIKEGMSAVEAVSCIRFMPHHGQKDYLHIRSSGNQRHFPHIGRTGGEQLFNVSTFDLGCSHRVTQELLQILGFHNMHQRFDRNKYVKILTENILPEDEIAFELITDQTEAQGTPYDFDSILHYSPDNFSKNGKDTIIPIDPEFIGKFGQANKLSAGDILRISRLYSCPGYKQLT